MSKSFDDLLKPEAVAELIGVTRRTVVAWAREHRLPAVRVGRFYRFDPVQIQRWIERNSR